MTLGRHSSDGRHTRGTDDAAESSRCSSRFSLSIGPTRTEPLFQGQSLKLILARAERHAGKAPQHGDMLDVGLDGAEDT